MKISPDGLELIKRHEGLRLKAYRCPAGVWTIGYGHTRGVKRGMVIAKVHAERFLQEDVVEVEGGVNFLVKVPVAQKQFDALASFAFNTGLDIDKDKIPEGLGDSTLLRKLNAGDYLGAADEFPKWVYSKRVKQPGLVARRAEEREMFLEGVTT